MDDRLKKFYEKNKAGFYLPFLFAETKDIIKDKPFVKSELHSTDKYLTLKFYKPIRLIKRK